MSAIITHIYTTEYAVSCPSTVQWDNSAKSHVACHHNPCVGCSFKSNIFRVIYKAVVPHPM
jgi:hypothetical protein